MKKKLLAILLSVIMPLTCVSALTACSDGADGINNNIEQSGNGNVGNDGDDGEVIEPKTTVDNSDEWYQAFMDTIHSENHTIQGEYINGSGKSGNYVTKRQGNKLSQNIAGEAAYAVIKQNELSTYYIDSQSEKWQSYTQTEEELIEDYGSCYGHLQFEIISFSMTDEPICMALSEALLGRDYSASESAPQNEEALKAIAAEQFETVAYNEEEGSYTAIINFSVGQDTVILKFLNGKISYLYLESIQGDWWVKDTCTFTYGNASVTIPEEILAAQPANG